MTFCFGITVALLRGSVTNFNRVNRMNGRLSWSLLVTTLKAFSVSWMTMPESPTRHGFLLCLTVETIHGREFSDQKI
jgi:hypothetical protein